MTCAASTRRLAVAAAVRPEAAVVRLGAAAWHAAMGRLAVVPAWCVAMGRLAVSS